MKAAVGELKARLSEYIRKVKSGHEVVITERGVPVAKVVPLAAVERRDSRRERLARAGILILGRGRASRSLLKPPMGSPSVGAGVLAALLEERRQRR